MAPVSVAHASADRPQGCCRSFFYDMFLPANYPKSVAEEYGRYQLWDTIQQVTFFVNTVISGVAIMKFHGVGDSTKTPEEATALSMGREFLATIFMLGVSTPFFKGIYQKHAGPSRALSGLLIAVGHFLEVLAGMFSNALALLYMGPVVCNVGSAIAGPTRQVILQEFVDGGHPPAKYGDVNLKEGNQDVAGKIAGLAMGLLMLVYLIGMSPDNPAQEQASLWLGMKYFVGLSIIHVAGNVMAVKQLKLSLPGEADKVQGNAPLRRQQSKTWKRMFFPNLDYMVDGYVRYRFFGCLGTLIAQPKNVVVNIVQWHFMWGVGDAKKTPADAQLLDMFIQSVKMVVALACGLPILRRFFKGYEAEWWKIVSGVLGLIADSVLFAAAFLSSQPQMFYPMIVAAQVISAFGSTCGSYVGGSITPLLIRPEQRRNQANPDGLVANVDVTMANDNQARVVKLTSQFFSIAFLYHLVWTESTPSFESLLTWYVIFQILNLLVVIGMYTYMPSLPKGSSVVQVAEQSLAEPLLTEEEINAPEIFRAKSLSELISGSGGAGGADHDAGGAGGVGPASLLRSISI